MKTHVAIKPIKINHLIVRQKGISLIELMLVIFLASLMAIWGGKNWYRYQQRERLVMSAQQLLSFLTQIKADADWSNRTISLWIHQANGSCVGSGSMKKISCEEKDNKVYTPAYNDILLNTFAQNEMGFYGRRNTAQPGHFILSNSAGRIRLVISNRGRMRLCSENKSIAGITACR
ncbi:hypothetical protein Rin_00018990 [Candidatus Regiella insecticola 5.15]|uniref:Prepilin-type N-terminal cleavage/methylation domain n=1 Tax=Candidatus Regiella insecticola 5.15 TaxID=1005043 RepID=G2H1F6_9ENTR|nr:prepilin peptidase-dependent protein [Candidatus Regiella insecticola]EGY28191.1 hypothetical protein Rin_00018990 [Candidatus Regiella insecticola 5.15]